MIKKAIATVIVLIFWMAGFAGTNEVPGSKKKSTQNTGKKKVFAHYMIAHLPGSSNTTVEDFKLEIRYAQEHGIDGFALNCGGWSEREPHYKKRTLEMYQAAKELNSGFLLFISADFCCNLTNEEFFDMIDIFRNHPNQFRMGKKTVISTFHGGEDGITALVKKRYKGDSAVYFVPFYYPIPATELPNDREVKQVYDDNSSLDGFFYFGAAGSPDSIAAVSRRIAKRWKSAGKTYMAPVTPFYQGVLQKPTYRLFECRGFEGMAKQWKAAIEGRADWVEIVTWNDYNENSYVAPAKTKEYLYSIYEDRNKWVLPHAAFLKASRYYAKWFKTGKEPVLKQDELYYFYRIHTKNAPSAFGDFKGRSDVQDSIFTTVYCIAPATLTVKVGTKTATHKLKKGVNHVASPLVEGLPQFILTRNGKSIFNKTGEYKIDDSNNWAEFNYHAGSGKDKQ